MTKLRTAFKKFDNQLKAFAVNLNTVQYSAFHRKIALDALTGIVENTPVLTGRARGDWQVSIGSPVEGNSGVLDTTPKGQPTIDRGTPIINVAPTFSVIYITNNVPYIIPLETGTSKKSPAGMVAITLERLGSVIG